MWMSKAEICVLDDNFASTVSEYNWTPFHCEKADYLAEGVAEGRLIFANLKRSIQYVVATIYPSLSKINYADTRLPILRRRLSLNCSVSPHEALFGDSWC